MDIAQIFGWIATILFSIMLIPQIVKTIKTKDTSGVSLLLFIIYLIANIFALIYAMMIYQAPLILKYAIAIITALLYIILFIIYFNEKKKNIKINKILD